MEKSNANQSRSLVLKLGFVVLAISLCALGVQAYQTIWAPYSAYEEPNVMGYLDKENPKSLTGGDNTHFHASSGEAFAQEIPNMGWGYSAAFDRGDGFFERPLQPAKPPGHLTDNDGLGPHYSATFCEGCHAADGRAKPPKNEHERIEEGFVRVSIPGKGPHGASLSPPGYGSQLSDQAVGGVKPEAHVRVKWLEVETGVLEGGEAYSLRKPEFLIKNLAYGPLPENTMYEMRLGPQVFGLGLLEAIKEEDLLAWSDPDDIDGDGISGRTNTVWDIERGGEAIGRFGWKANSFDVRQQSAEAAYFDLGMNNPLFFYRYDDQQKDHKARQNCEPEQLDCLQAQQNDDFEMTPAQLTDVTTYLQTLGVVYRREVDNPIALRGEALFASAGCVACHKTNITTGESEIPRLENQLIHPYTDLLLHDMGEGLKGRPDFDASRTEWRTQPLWGIGMIEKVNGHTNFLHDGRARNIQEAILWHGGEAEQAKQFYASLQKKDRAAILKFLNTL